MDLVFFEEHKKKFGYLESMRQTGKYNSFMLALPLRNAFNISHEDADAIVVFWMEHYAEIQDRFKAESALTIEQ